MKILMVIPALTGGGAENVFLQLAHHLLRWGHEPAILTFASSQSDVYPVPDGVCRFSLSVDNRKWYRPGSYLRILRGIRKHASDLKPDLYLSFLVKANILVTYALRSRKEPLVLSDRSILQRRDYSFLTVIGRRIFYPQADFLVVMTQAVAASMSRFLPSTKIFSIPNPVSTSATPSNGEDTSVNVKTLFSQSDSIEGIIASAGRLHPVKGFDLLLRAFSTISGEFPRWRLLILGDGEDRQRLDDLSRALGIAQKVALPGRVPFLHPYLSQCHLFALSSRAEGFGIVLLEAMAAGLPVVSFDCPVGPREIITHDVDGILVPPENPDALAAAIKRMIGDSSLRNRLSAQCKTTVKKYEPERVFRQWEQALLHASLSYTA